MSAPSSAEVLALNSRQIARKLLDERRMPEDFLPEHFDWYWQAAYGVSAAYVSAGGEESLHTKSWQDCFNPSSAAISPEMIFNVASISKPITAATILRMMEDKKYATYFPEKLDTKLSHFYEMLEARYPDSSYVKTRLRGENPEISIRDLITHTSGIGDFDIPKYGQQFRFESPENLARPGDGKHLEPERNDGKYGEYKYSDIGYELLGMLISAAATDLARRTSSGDVVTCGAVMREMVIDRLELERTFTPDEMGFDESGRVMVLSRPEQEIARGYDCQYTGRNLIESKVFRRCISASAIYSTPRDICEFARRTFSGKTFAEGGLFDSAETIRMQQDFAVVCKYEDVKNEAGEVIGRKPKVTPMGIDYYGIGYSFLAHEDGRKTLTYHGARTAGYSGWFGYRDGEAACCLVNCQNLTPYFARALIERELGRAVDIDNEPAAIHGRFAQINAELFARYSAAELLGALERAEFNPDPKIKSKAENHAALLREIEMLEKLRAAQPRGLVVDASAEAVLGREEAAVRAVVRK